MFDRFLEQLDSNEVFIADMEKLASFQQLVQMYGCIVVADFDGTVTPSMVDGLGNSLFSVVWRHNFGNPFIKLEVERTLKKYYPYYGPQVDGIVVTPELRARMLHEWVSHNMNLMIMEGLHLDQLRRIANEERLVLKPGFHSTLDLMQDQGIPLIFCTAGLEDLLTEVLVAQGLMHPGIHIIGNSFNFDENDRAIGISQTVLPHSKPIYVEQRLAQLATEPYIPIVLLGDHQTDRDMVALDHYPNQLMIGFTNRGRSPDVAEVSDVVVTSTDLQAVYQFLAYLVAA